MGRSLHGTVQLRGVHDPPAPAGHAADPVTLGRAGEDLVLIHAASFLLCDLGAGRGGPGPRPRRPLLLRDLGGAGEDLVLVHAASFLLRDLGAGQGGPGPRPRRPLLMCDLGGRRGGPGPRPRCQIGRAHV